jgi:IclR family acetate operon transcriptional repressor
MARLVNAYGETANLAMRHGDDLVIVDAVESNRSIKRGAQIGQRDTWHNSSVGKAVLAQLPPSEVERLVGAGPFARATDHTITEPQRLFEQLAEIRRAGFATDLEEAEVGLRCVGVAIRDTDGSPRFALSVSGPATRLTDSLIAEIGRELVEVSREVSLGDAPLSGDPPPMAP